MNAAHYMADALLIRERLKGGRAEELARLRINQGLALAIVVLLGPLMLAIAMLIWSRERAPVLFGHYRVGAGGRPFRCFKFRTMRLDADRLLAELLQHDPAARAQWQADRKLKNDPRVTLVGDFLRRTSLDELPQLFNVIRGEMNLVGPRPVTASELGQYGIARWHYMSVRPGMTGLWQVNGRSNTTYQERVAFDREYVEKRSWGLDFRILLRTFAVVLARDGAH